MRVVVTGQVGLDKEPFLAAVAGIARSEGLDVEVCHVGRMMYAEAPDVAAGRILDLPLSRLTGLRRSVFKDVLETCRQHANVLVNTHATFRWRHGLFYAFDYDQMKALDADLYVAVVDNIDRVQRRLLRDGHADHTLKDLMVWREEEVLATELLAQIVRGHGRFFIVARGDGGGTPGEGDPFGPARMLERLVFHPELRKAYLSFPMTHLDGSASSDARAEVDAFRRQMKRHFTCFDPGDVEEKELAQAALAAAQEGRRTVEVGPAGSRAALETPQLLEIIADIDGQIYARDFKLIDQSDMIVSMVPALADGRPAISSGVERELQHAHEAAKEVYVIWRPEAAPSPFVTETATGVFRSAEEAMRFFADKGFIPDAPKAGLFA